MFPFSPFGVFHSLWLLLKTGTGAEFFLFLVAPTIFLAFLWNFINRNWYLPGNQGRRSELIKNHSKQVEKNNAKVERQYGGLLNQAMFQRRYGLHSICTATIWFAESYFFNNGQWPSSTVVSDNLSTKGEAVNGSARWFPDPDTSFG